MVTGPTALPPLATKEQYEAMTGGPAPANIDDLLNAASAGIRRYCGWHIAPNLVQDLVLDGPGAKTLILPTLRLTAINAIAEYFGSLTYDYIPAIDLTWSATGRIRKVRGTNWTTEFGGIAANIAHGFDLAEVADLSQLVLAIVARSVINPYGYAQQSVGGVTLSMPSVSGSTSGVSLTDTQAYLLDSYRLERAP